MLTNYAQELLEAVNWLLQSKGLQPLQNDRTVFAMDADISYAVEWTVPASKLHKPEQLNQRIESIISNGPSWIHANLIPTTDDRSLIALHFGALVGNPNPSINVSYEVNWVIKVVTTDSPST